MAQSCGLGPQEAYIMYFTKPNGPGYSSAFGDLEFATAVPSPPSTSSHKSQVSGLVHPRWIQRSRPLRKESLCTAGEECYTLETQGEISSHPCEPLGWRSVSQVVAGLERARARDDIDANTPQSTAAATGFSHILASASGNVSLIVAATKNGLRRSSLTCAQATDFLRTNGPIERRCKKLFVAETVAGYGMAGKRKADPTLLRTSLEVLRFATSIYERFENATVSMAIVKQPLHRAKWFIPGVGPELSLNMSLPQIFACLAMFDSGSLNLDPESLPEIMAMSSGSSLYISDSLLNDPLKSSLAVDSKKPGVTRMLGNVGKPGIAMLAPPQEPNVRPRDLGAWRVINHAPHTGELVDNFTGTSMHLSFSKYEGPMSTEVGVKDIPVTMLETLVSVHDRGPWVADLDNLKSMKNGSLFTRLQPPLCGHHRTSTMLETKDAATQIGQVLGKRLISIDSWDELIDPPEHLGETTIGVVHACDNWHARLAAMSVSVQKGHRTVVVPSLSICTECSAETLIHLPSNVKIIIQ